jgi:hypothetical protein
MAATPEDEWEVRPVRGQLATKPYRCPHCEQVIPVGQPHVVVWPVGSISGDALAQRRHWHTACWRRAGRLSG